ncbi:AraC family transcriptional regulator [Pleomorphomonas diazotrophica]|uniref:AraC family transcriptional regulator n=1 Tax=Pleomorphomonas diazotrophica TaxID=1166257 RepID=A0A1I4ULP8_9HYPH|nr:AraC family transcriptional regulator [Pleomorphomonas diazotrophica]PKR88368.1 AraC family transcriptional regulator [Pleomorphomonas diazotrophica]SFM89929.1 AraC-type DNA-binding protein [Pleomorphomonas diazotrophica]
MTETLLSAARRHAAVHADASGVAPTPIPGLAVVRATMPSALQYAINRPLVALVLQGEKRVTIGPETLDFGAGASLLISADVPTVSQITRASAAVPYISLVLELDLGLIEALAVDMAAVPAPPGPAVRVEPTDAEVAEAALRLMRLLDRPAALPVLGNQLLRELHYWLLAGRHGSAMRGLGVKDSHAQRISRAVAMLRAEFAAPIRVERLADIAGLSPSAFHQHFKAITSLSPLQFQKQLRLIEARRLMLSEGLSASLAAYEVGYESVQQFNREYARLFGQPPGRDLKASRERAVAA